MATREHIDEGLARRTKALRETPEEERKKAWIEKTKSSLEKVVAAASIAGFMKERVLKTASTGAAYYTEEYVDYNAFLKHLIELVYNLGDDDTWHPEGALVFRADETINQVSIRDSVTRGPLVNMSNLNDALFNIMKDQRRDSAAFFGRMCAAFLTRRLSQDLVEKIREALWNEVENSGLLESKSALGLGSKVKKVFRDTEAVGNISIIPFKDKEVERICHASRIYTFSDAFKLTEPMFAWWIRKNHKIETFEEFQLFKRLNKVDDYMFEECVNLEKIVLPDNIKSIGKEAFSNCWALRDFEFPKSVEVIRKRAFFGCDSLKKIILPEGLTTIEDEAFFNCAIVEVLFIPKTVSKIGNRIITTVKTNLKIFVERGCPVLSMIKENFYNYEIIEIDSPEALNESSSLGLNSKVKKKFDKVDAIDNLEFEFVDLGLPSGYMWAKYNVGSSDVNDAGSLLNHSEAVDAAFENKLKLPTTEDFNELKKYCHLEWVEATYSNTSISGLELTSLINGNKIFFPAGGHYDNKYNTQVEHLNKFCYYWTQTKSDTEMPGEYFMSLVIGNSSIKNDSDIYHSFWHSKSSDTLSVRLISSRPQINEMNGFSLGLAKRVSREYDKKTEDDVVKEISYIQFEDPIVEETMHNLGIFTIQDAQNCPEDFFIRNKFFDTDIKSFNELELFNNIEKFRIQCFAKCMNLSSIKLPRSLRIISNGCFLGCVALKEIEIPNTVLEICPVAFMSSQLNSIYIPDSVKKIGYGCFAHCKFLKEVSLPASLETLGDEDQDVFFGCDHLEVVNVRLAKAPWTVNKFKDFFKMIYDNAVVKEVIQKNNKKFPIKNENIKILYNGVEVEMDENGYPIDAESFIYENFV